MPFCGERRTYNITQHLKTNKPLTTFNAHSIIKN